MHVFIGLWDFGLVVRDNAKAWILFLFLLSHDAVGMAENKIGIFLLFLNWKYEYGMIGVEKTDSKFEEALLADGAHFEVGEGDGDIDVGFEAHSYS